MAIAIGTCVSFCNQPIRYIIWLPTRVTPVCRCLQPFGGCRIWLYVESLRHILTSHGYAPGTIAINVTWIERQFNGCQTRRSMYPSIFNRFPVIQTVSLKVRHFSYFLYIFASPWVRPWDNRDKCYMDGKRIQCWSNASQHVTIYLQSFTSYSEILVWNCNFFLPLAFNASVGVFPLEFREKVWFS